MTDDEAKDQFAREQRDFSGLNGNFALFVAWRQMKALEAIAGDLAKAAAPPSWVIQTGPVPNVPRGDTGWINAPHAEADAEAYRSAQIVQAEAYKLMDKK